MHTSTETDSRWSSESPLGFAAGDTNLQRYVGNSPTNYTDPTGLWREGGHFYTVYNMGRLSGLDHNRARELAYYAQYPDEVDAYDAVFVASPHGPGRWHDAGDAVGTHYENINGQRWEELIQRDLHQLHGGDMPEIHKRREHLKKLFNEAMGECDYKFAGVILHALGDSFAHTYLDRHGRRRAFDSAVGHGTALGPLTGTWQGGKAVDKIRERYADNAYPHYIDFLADLLGVSDADALLDRMRPTLGDDGVVRTQNGVLYTDEREDSLLKTFPVSGKMISGARDNYFNNEMQSPLASRYFPEGGLHGGIGRISFEDMRTFIDQMRP